RGQCTRWPARLRGRAGPVHLKDSTVTATGDSARPIVATGRKNVVDMGGVEVIAPNFKRRLSGVTSTIIQLVPLQARMLGIATLGPGLPDSLPKIRWWQVPWLLKRPQSGRRRIWHARRT